MDCALINIKTPYRCGIEKPTNDRRIDKMKSTELALRFLKIALDKFIDQNADYLMGKDWQKEARTRKIKATLLSEKENLTSEQYDIIDMWLGIDSDFIKCSFKPYSNFDYSNTTMPNISLNWKVVWSIPNITIEYIK